MWNYKSVNESCNKLSRFRVHKEHLERLIQARSYIDDNAKKTPEFLKIPPSLRMPAKDNIRKIDYENKILYTRMYSILMKKSPYSASIVRPVPCPAFDFKKCDYNKKYSLYELQKRNQWLCSRFTDAKSFYPTKNFFRQGDFNEYLRKGLQRSCSNPNINFATYAEFKQKLARQIMSARKDRSGYNKSLSNNKSLYTNRAKSASVKNMSFSTNRI